MKAKILKILVIFFFILTISATYYKTVVLEDIPLTGIWVEKYSDGSVYAFFIYNNEEFEIETEVSSLDELYKEALNAIAEEDMQPDEELYSLISEGYELAEEVVIE